MTQERVVLDRAVHNHSTYSSGCRCDVCTADKARYMSERRAAGRNGWKDGRLGVLKADGKFIANIKRHGTRFGYEEKGCRCPDCTHARTSSDARYRK